MVLCLSLCPVDRMKRDVSRILLQISIDTGRSIDQNLKDEVFKKLFLRKKYLVCRDEFYKRLYVIKIRSLFLRYRRQQTNH